jgi:hypothetical protein
VAALLGAVAVYLWLSGLQIHHAYAAYCHPSGSLACTLSFTGRYGVTGIIVSTFLQAVPALIGAFVGAPVLAREMETGTKPNLSGWLLALSALLIAAAVWLVRRRAA